MITELYLIGTHHFDPQGPDRLRKLLTKIRPQVITLESDEIRIKSLEKSNKELTPEKLEKIIKDLQERIPGSTIEGIRNYFENTGYEYKESKIYADRYNIPLVPIDKFDEEFEAARGDWNHPTKRHSTLYLKVNMRRLKEIIEREYSEETIEIPKGIKEISLEYRDSHMESRIREQKGKVVHIGGMTHLYGAYINLYNRLQSLSPRRIKLNEADKI
jgi:pheromone shutdown protein TraB